MNDAPLAQTPKGLFVDLIAQHPGLAEELRAIDELPMPAQTPPPRLTDAEIFALCKSVPDTFNVMKYHRAIESAVRKQFGVNDE